LGRIESNGVAAKPAREVKVADMLRVKTSAAEFEIEVLGLSEMRGPAAVAQALYRETDESRARRAKAVEDRKAAPRFDFEFQGKPSKKDRRRIDRLRGRY